MKSGDMRRYPSSYPYKWFMLTLTREVRQQAGVPYSYSHLSSTRGKRARWRAVTNVVFYTFCHPETASQVPGGYTLWSSAPFVNQGEWVRRYQDDVGHPILIILKNFAGFYSRLPETFKPDDTRDSSLLGGDDQAIACGNVMVIPFYHFQGTEVLLTLLMPFLFFLNDRFRWLGYWSAEWCSTRTKLVSDLYFPFNKR